MDAEQKLEKLNRKVKQLFDLYEVDWEDPAEVNYQMRYALARFYSEEGVRKYLENMVKQARKDGSDAVTVMDIVRYKERQNTLMQILTTAKAMFNEAEKLPKGIQDA